MRRSLAFVIMSCLATAAIAAFSAAADQEKPKTPEEKAWEQVDSLDAQSLRDFLKEFPNGKLAQDAKAGLELQDKLASIKNGKSKDDFIIPLDALGERWKAWQKRKPEKGVMGYFAAKAAGGGTVLGWFSPGPLRGGKTPGGDSIEFDAAGIMASPTGDGSIIAIRTGGSKYEIFSGLVFETPADEPMYFGVIEGRGLVHLKGTGKVTLPNGKTTDLK